MGPLHRARWGHRIQRFVDDELPRRHTAVVVRHLSGCPDCADELQTIRRLKTSLGRLAERRPSDLAVARLRAEAARIASP